MKFTETPKNSLILLWAEKFEILRVPSLRLVNFAENRARRRAAVPEIDPEATKLAQTASIDIYGDIPEEEDEEANAAGVNASASGLKPIRQLTLRSTDTLMTSDEEDSLTSSAANAMGAKFMNRHRHRGSVQRFLFGCFLSPRKRASILQRIFFSSLYPWCPTYLCHSLKRTEFLGKI